MQTAIIKDYSGLQEIRKHVSYYTLAMVQLSDNIMSLSARDKLIILQKTPDQAIKKRRVGSYMIPYVKIGYIERCLNFVSNFNRSQEIINQGYKEYKEIRQVKDPNTGEYIDKEYHVLDARVAMKYTILIDGKIITHSTYGTWNMYKNPAISDYSVLEACRSQATKSFADILGIASDKLTAENQKIQEAREKLETRDTSGIFEQNIAEDFGGVPPTKADEGYIAPEEIEDPKDAEDKPLTEKEEEEALKIAYFSNKLQSGKK